MADVQLEHGYTRIADELLEALARTRLPGQHIRIMLTMIRLLYGYQKTSDKIPARQIAAIACLEERATRRALADLVVWGLLDKAGGGPGRPAQWSICKDWEAWRVGQTIHSRRFTQGAQPRVHSPGCTAPGKEPRPGAQPRGSTSGTQGAQHPKTQGAQPPLQRERENYQRELHPSGDASGAAPPAGRSRWLNLLKGKPPNGYESAEAWLEEHLPIVEGEVDAELGAKADATQRNGKIKSLLCRYWRNKSGRGPPARSIPGSENIHRISGWKHG